MTEENIPGGIQENTPEGTPLETPSAGPEDTAVSAAPVIGAELPESATPVAAPPVGAMVPSGSRVVLVVSSGPPATATTAFVEMPDIVGERQGDALSVLQDTGLSVQVFNDYSLTVERGRVMAQRPTLGLSVASGSEVVLLVSSGSAASLTHSVPLPRLAGLSEGEAVTKLQAAGLSPQVVRASDASVPAGIVIAQLPDEVSLAALPRKRRSTTWIWIITALVMATALGGAFFYYQSQPLVVPNVVGLTQAQAEGAITAAGFNVGSVIPTQTLSAEEIGNVVTQTPAPNAEAKRGSDITIAVSGGQALVEVPNVTGAKQADAEKALKAAGFQIAIQQSYNSTVAKGLIISQSPAAGQKVPTGTTIGVTVSQGAESVIVPGLIGQAKAAALEALKAAGLGAQAVSNYFDGVPSGQVYGQVPTAGTALPPATVVGLLVSNGPIPSGTSTATVPATIGKSATDAQTALKNAKLVGVSILWSGTGKPNNIVVGQIPDAGVVMARNGSVIIIVSNGK